MRCKRPRTPGCSSRSIWRARRHAGHATVQEYPTTTASRWRQIAASTTTALLPTSSPCRAAPTRPRSPNRMPTPSPRATACRDGVGQVTSAHHPPSDNRVDLGVRVAEGGVVETERLSFVGTAPIRPALRPCSKAPRRGLLRHKKKKKKIKKKKKKRSSQRDTFHRRAHRLDRHRLLTISTRIAAMSFPHPQRDPATVPRTAAAYFLTFNILGKARASPLVSSQSCPRSPASMRPSTRMSIRIAPGETYSPRIVDNTILPDGIAGEQRACPFVRVDRGSPANDAARTNQRRIRHLSG